MAENTEGEILENLKTGMVDNTEGEVLENLKKVNESLCRVVHMLQGPNSGETSDATKSISSTSLPRPSGPNTSSIFAEPEVPWSERERRKNEVVFCSSAPYVLGPRPKRHGVPSKERLILSLACSST